MKDFVTKFSDLDFWGKFLVGFIVVLIVLLFIVFCVFIYIYFAWVLTILWKWFIVPLGLNELSLKSAFGVILIIGLIRGLRTVSEKDIEINLKQTIWSLISAPALMLFVGYIITLVL